MRVWLRVTCPGYATLPENLELRLYSTPSAASRFAVFRADDEGKLTKVLGRRLNEPEEAAVRFSEPLAPSGERLYVEAHQYPNAGFEGLLTVEVPVLFQVQRTSQGQFARTVAFFPDLVNHLVIGNTSIVPKPYGPVIEHADGKVKCAFETAFRKLLPNRTVRFIDDWHSYHELMGEVDVRGVGIE